MRAALTDIRLGRLQVLKQRQLTRCLTFLSQEIPGPLQQRDGPTPVEHEFRSQRCHVLEGITLGGIVVVEGNHRLSTTPFLGLGFLEFDGDKALEANEQKRTETALGGIGARHPIPFDQRSEEGLNEILGVDFVLPRAPEKGVERIPIRAAKLLQRVLTVRRREVTRPEDHAPVRGGEQPG